MRNLLHISLFKHAHMILYYHNMKIIFLAIEYFQMRIKYKNTKIINIFYIYLIIFFIKC